ncbi:MAG: hypothetical protein C0593_08530 [Marinilabiliales bacterium]|nr:MAG: hypothetical protein C0593_08530 [Marinilabiliales bacterium]
MHKVNVLNKLEIPFKGLSDGVHEFEYHVSDAFFEAIEYSDVKKGNVSAKISLDKQPGMMQLHFRINGYVTLTCDRCLEDFNFPIDTEDHLIVKIGPEPGEESEEVIIIADTEYKLQLWHYIYEYISLQVPYRKTHPEDENGNSTCDPEQIKRIEDLNSENRADPRWDALKNLKLDD